MDGPPAQAVINISDDSCVEVVAKKTKAAKQRKSGKAKRVIGTERGAAVEGNGEKDTHGEAAKGESNKKKGRKRKADDAEEHPETPAKKRVKKQSEKKKVEEADDIKKDDEGDYHDEGNEDGEDDEGDKKQKKREKKKPVRRSSSLVALRELEAAVAASAPTGPVDMSRLIGAHVSIAGKLETAVLRSHAMGANALAIFLRSPRQWAAPALAPDAIAGFKNALAKCKIAPTSVLPHGSYLCNLGTPFAEKHAMARGMFLDEVQRCEALGISLFNFHPGSRTAAGQEMGISHEASMTQIADAMNYVLDQTAGVTLVLENTAGEKNVYGGSFEQLRFIIDRVKDQSRVGVCLDTCHLFAYGHDISTPAGFNTVMESFDRIVGLRYLKGMHLNDSKGALGSKKDRHESIGKGQLGLEAFRFIMRDPRFAGIPMVLETPGEDIERAKEIALLRSLGHDEPRPTAGDAVSSNEPTAMEF